MELQRCYFLMMRDEAPPWFVAVGASGSEGLSDISALLAALPPPIPAVVLVVLHRWAQPSRLKAILTHACPHPVLIAEEGERLSGVACISVSLTST
jgi:two-component system chemotaxis response regulator CheB